jgi:predicted PurR-regulated permease PerM
MMHDEKVNQFVVILLVIFISAIFLSMIRSFLMAIFLAGIFSALAYPLYLWLVKKLNGRQSLASVLTLLFIVLVILLPLGALTAVVTDQAIEVSQRAVDWVKLQLAEPGAFTRHLESIPYYDNIAPYRETILQKAGEMVGKISQFVIDNLSAVTKGAISFLFMLFVWLYTMYFFLIDGPKLLERILYYLPLQNEDEQRMLEKFTSVSRATLKGSAVIGILQGSLAGIAFWAVGIPSAIFWGVIMTVMSIIPSIGTAVIWGPAAVILAVSGSYGKAVGLFIFCAIIVGSLDNLLRPILVGKDTQMHELMIFFSTLGGIFMFGIVGVIIGPIIAALFVTIWEIYGLAFQAFLPDTGYVLGKEAPEAAVEQDRTERQPDI